MNKRIDGRTLKGQRIRQEVRERILTAYVELIREGAPSPTARATATRAGLSLRVIFKHFSDLRALRLASFNRMQALSNQFFSEKLPDSGSAAERLERFVQRHMQRLEYVTPIRRTAAMVENIDPDVAAGLRDVRNGALRDLKKMLGPTLKAFSNKDKRELLTALHMVCSWESWETLRAHYHMHPRRAREIITRVALTVLAEAELRARAHRAATGRPRRQRAG